MARRHFDLSPIPESSFGGVIRFRAPELRTALDALEAEPDALPQALYASQGLLLFPGLSAITDDPALLVRLSRLFGPEVENYHETLTTANLVHESVPEILVLSNLPPSNREPPARPDPPYTTEGKLPVQFPHRKGWHTDQSFRRPPPDFSLFYAVVATPSGAGQTLFANGFGAYDGLSDEHKRKIDTLEGLHALPSVNRSETAVRSGDVPVDLLPHQMPQRQPMVRTHPVTGKRALYLCEDGQMDWVDGPVVGMSPGPDGDGAALLYELMSHFTGPRYTYAHEWQQSDLVVYDNRNLLHCATWYDSSRYTRKMWRTTVMGNPGKEYAGEPRSWVPAEGVGYTEGLARQ